MNLKYELSKEYEKAIALLENERIKYCAPYDIGDKKEFITQGYFVVTDLRLVVLSDCTIRHEYQLKDLESIRCEVMVDNGLLVACKAGVDYILARFSMKHVARYSYIARGATLLAKGDKQEVVSKEMERTCSRCNRALPGTNTCLHCNGRMLVLKRFWELCGGYHLKLMGISCFMIIASLVNLLMPQIQKNFIDQVLNTGNGEFSEVLIFIGKMFALTSILLIISLVRNIWCATLGSSLSVDLRRKLYHKLQVLSLSCMQKRKPGDLMHRITWDTGHIRGFMEDIFSHMISTLITMIGAFLAMLIMSPVLMLVSTVFIFAVIFLNQVFRIKTRRMFSNQGRKGDKINSALQDVLSGIRVVKAFGKEREEADIFHSKVVEYAAVQKRNEVFWAYFFPLLTFIMGIGIYFATYFGGLSVLNGRMTAGELMQFITYTSILYGPLGWMNHLPRLFRRMIVAMERIYDILDEEPEIIDSKEAKNININGSIEFNSVNFGYKSYEQILTGIDLKVEPGEMIGLVGSSGTGKSTLINLLMRLYDVDEGKIMIDGVDIRDIKSDSLHTQLGVVLQETFLFSGTILNNLRFAKPEASMEEIIIAAKAANAHDFIVKMPDGYNTYVGEHGYTLSGGERQRIAIARAIINDPKLLILDEATSSLDTESEYLIQQALNRLRKGRTTFAIAHRLSTLREANRLVVIDGRKIAEIGTHNELLEKKGIYYKLVKAQLEMQKVGDMATVS